MSDVKKLFSYLGPLNGLMDAIAKANEVDTCDNCGEGSADKDVGEEKKETKCPMGGDKNDDCWECAHGGDYHYKDGECVKRPDSIIL